jgi:hypothetical protein
LEGKRKPCYLKLKLMNEDRDDNKDNGEEDQKEDEETGESDYAEEEDSGKEEDQD